MGFFDTYHAFAHYQSVEGLVQDASRINASAQVRATFQVYHESVLTKLWGAQMSLESLLLMNLLDIFGVGKPSDELVRDRMTLSHYLDTFFASAVSALEMGAQEVNLAYNLGLNEQEVNVWALRDSLQTNRAGMRIENHFQNLVTPPAGDWYIQLNNYRKCALHRKMTLKEIRGEFSAPGTITTSTDFKLVTMRVALPNDPLPLTPVFDPANEIEMNSYCKQSFTDLLASMDRLLEIIEADLGAAGQMPIP